MRSLSARRAWIEIVKLFRQNYECFVALRKESVDRNLLFLVVAGSRIVALRKESVDRNRLIRSLLALLIVALRKESVDRNFNAMQIVIIEMKSLSARRAWIEMPVRC